MLSEGIENNFRFHSTILELWRQRCLHSENYKRNDCALNSYYTSIQSQSARSGNSRGIDHWTQAELLSLLEAYLKPVINEGRFYEGRQSDNTRAPGYSLERLL